MVRMTFEGFLKDIAAFYERKVAYTDKTKDIWFGKVQNIPDESIPWIYDRITDEFEGFPKNIKSAMWVQYHAWLDSHPDKRVAKDFFKCPDCLEGLIWCHKKVGERYYGYLFRCSRCHQDKTRGYPVGSKIDLMNEGYVFDYKPVPPRLRNRGNVGAILKESVGLDIIPF